MRTLFDDEDERRSPLLNNLRLNVIETAVQYGMDMVFTVGYTDSDNSLAFIERLVRAVTEKGGTVHFVRLNPPDATLFERIDGESRGKLRKSTSSEELSQLLKTKNFRATIDYPSHLELDTSQLTPEDSARRVIERFDLPARAI